MRPHWIFPVGISSLGLLQAVAVPDFTVVALPDTQNYSDEFPAQYSAQTQWIADNVAAENIKFVTHLGDFVDNHDDDRQWDNADAAMLTLDGAGVPWGGIPGNHDFLYGAGADDFTGSRYRALFGPARFAGKPWYRGSSPSELSNYQVIDVGGGYEILFLHINLETPAAELSWAQGVLNANRDKPVFVSTHRYLQDAEDYTSGVPLVASGRFPQFWYTFEPLYRPDGIASEVFFNTFVKANRNIFLVHCGHFHEEYRQTSTNNFGLAVHEILADFQDDPNGGDGWLRLLRFRPDADEVFVRTFSPTRNGGAGEFRTSGESQFLLNVDLDAYVLPPQTSLLRFQQGSAGYAGTVDTWVNEASKGSSYGSAGGIVVDNDVSNNVFFSDERGNGLLRFEGIFLGAPVYEGDPAPAAIPPGATISSATLTINVTDDNDSPIYDEDIFLHRAAGPWSEASTWDSLGGGIPGPGLGAFVAEIDGDNNPAGNTVRTVDVKSTVEAWLGGAANHGFVLTPEDISGNDDGFEIASSENGDAGLRPALDVQFSYPVLNRPPAVVPLAASRLSCNEGESVVLTLSATDPNPSDPVILRLNGADAAFGVGAAQLAEPVVMEQDGSYVFTAVVADDEDTVAGGSVTVAVQNADPAITSLTGDLAVDVGEPFAFEATATDPGILDVLTYEWDLDGDGGYDDASGSSGSHSFAGEGTFVVGLRVRDGDGGEATSSFSVVVRYTFATWAAAFGLTGGVAGDDDGDGTSNGDEFEMRFDPTDPGQRLDLEIDAIDHGTGEITLRIPFVSDAGVYHIYQLSSLGADPSEWTLLYTHSPAAAHETDVTHVHRVGALPARGFYLVKFVSAP